jgi:hypothetical protein
MGTNPDHRKFAEECIAMACASEDSNDKALWVTLAQSWVRLAEHAAQAQITQAQTTQVQASREDHASREGVAAVRDALAVQPAD